MVSMATEWIGDFLPMLPQTANQIQSKQHDRPWHMKKEKNAHSGMEKERAVHTSGQNEIDYLK